MLEHLEDPTKILERVSDWVFISIPIFTGPEDARNSKHYKPGEHIWYFTEKGLILFMKMQGFGFIDSNRMEEDIGREGIGSYVFKRERS